MPWEGSSPQEIPGPVCPTFRRAGHRHTYWPRLDHLHLISKGIGLVKRSRLASSRSQMALRPSPACRIGGCAPPISSSHTAHMKSMRLAPSAEGEGLPNHLFTYNRRSEGPVWCTSSPLHNTPAHDREVVTLFLPDLVDRLRQATRQRDAGGLGTLPLLDHAEPRAQWAWAACRLCRGQDQCPAQQPVPFLADVPQADCRRRGSHARGQSQVAGHMLGAGKAPNLSQLQDQQDRHKRTNARNSDQATHPGIVAPAMTYYSSMSSHRICSSSRFSNDR